MTMTDPIADMLTRIRNANSIERTSVDIPYSRLKEGIAEALKREGFIEDFTVRLEEDQKKGWLIVRLKYGPEGEHVITHIDRYSKVGCRRYRGVDELPEVRGGMG